MIWVTADHHFGHANILKPDYANRPVANVDEMDALMVERWNQRVASGDEVWHLGDFITWPRDWVRVREIRNRLNGQIRMIKGNHDTGSWGRYILSNIHPLFEPGDPGIKYHAKHALVLTHRPPSSYGQVQAVLGPLGNGALWLHGHSHCKGIIRDPRVMDMGVDHQQRQHPLTYLDGRMHVDLFGHPIRLDELLGENYNA